jgi:thymidylate synthase ThyX
VARFREAGVKNDYTRELLPLGTATAFYMTGWDDQFRGMIKLRSAPAAHEGARFIAESVRRDLDALSISKE